MTARLNVRNSTVDESFMHPMILIADDDPATRLLMRCALEEEGYMVEEAADGTEVIENYRKQTPDMILMDAIMPMMDGFEACVELKNKYGSDCAPILTITGLNDESSVERAFAVGACDFITKPIHWPVLLQRVRRIIDATQADKLLTTERRRTEEERGKFEQQLRQAHKMEAIGQLTGGIAHDFNNILAGIVGFTDMAIDDIDDRPEKVSEYLKEISRAADRARDLIRKMLIFCRKGEEEDKRILIDVLLVIKEVVKLLRSTFPAGIKIIEEYDADLSQVLIDPVQLHQIIMNMGINARDALEGHGEILIRTHKISFSNVMCSSCHEGFSGDFLEIVMQDNGEGINKEKLSRVFEPFFTTKEVGRGTGMGLAVVHGIVHDCDGHIIVESSPGEGSKFSLFFPVTDSNSITNIDREKKSSDVFDNDSREQIK